MAKVNLFSDELCFEILVKKDQICCIIRCEGPDRADNLALPLLMISPPDKNDSNGSGPKSMRLMFF